MILIDPALLNLNAADAQSEAWHLLVDWAADRRAKVGEFSFSYIIESFQASGWPDAPLTVDGVPARKEFELALSNLLSRMIETDATKSHEVTTDPEYSVNQNAATH